MSSPRVEPGTLWTVGHSNRGLDEFLAILAAHRIERIADVRRHPGSRLHPHFGRESLAESLAAAAIDYRHFPELGGRRGKPAENSPNTAWRVEAFNAYADYMQTLQFTAALEELAAAARDARTAILCAEALPWQCHRRLIADAMIAAGWTVLDIFSAAKVEPHRLPPFAKVADARVTYPGETLF